MTKRTKQRVLPVGEAKRRFSELIDRVGRGEQILISRRGELVVALVRPTGERDARPAPIGLAAMAGALADFDDLEDVVGQTSAALRRARDRPVPEFE